jgi:hypothetical protein
VGESRSAQSKEVNGKFTQKQRAHSTCSSSLVPFTAVKQSREGRKAEADEMKECLTQIQILNSKVSKGG